MTTYRERVRKEYRKARDEGRKACDALSTARYEAKYGERSTKRDMMPDRYSAYVGEEITTLPNGWKIKVAFEHDEDHAAPWEECDGHGVIEGSLDNPGMAYAEWILSSDWGRWRRYYDWKATLPIAIKDGWDAPPYRTGTKHEQAMRAMRADYEYLRRWCEDDWWYVGMIVTLLDEDDTELGEESCWGFESDSMSYLTYEARTWAAWLIRKERAARRAAARQQRINNRFADAMACGI